MRATAGTSRRSGPSSRGRTRRRRGRVQAANEAVAEPREELVEPVDLPYQPGRPRKEATQPRADRVGADQGGHGVAPGGDPTIRGDDVPGVEHPFLGNPGQQGAPGLNRLEPDSSAEVDAVDPPGKRAADSAVAVIEEDVGADRKSVV